MHSASILVIEDDDDFREILRDLLTDEGEAVAVASSRDDALALLKIGLRPKVIVMDLMMPGIDSETFSREMRALSLQTPMIVLSAAGSDVLPTPAGAAMRLRKPPDLKKFVTAVKSLMGLSR